MQYTTHQAHKSSWGISQTKRNQKKLIIPIPSPESSLVDVLFFDAYLMVSWYQVNLQENFCSLKLIQGISKVLKIQSAQNWCQSIELADLNSTQLKSLKTDIYAPNIAFWSFSQISKFFAGWVQDYSLGIPYADWEGSLEKLTVYLEPMVGCQVASPFRSKLVGFLLVVELLGGPIDGCHVAPWYSVKFGLRAKLDSIGFEWVTSCTQFKRLNSHNSEYIYKL